MHRTAICAGLALGTLTLPALGQTSNISPVEKWSWGENIGWQNWRDAGDPDASQGAVVHETFLSGFVWGENVGWINLGDGTPGQGQRYGNATGADFGVNIAQDGTLEGLAWGENIGWINFHTAPTLQQFGQHARFDAATARFRGFAWGENVDWINLDDDEHFVGQTCTADWNADGAVNTIDFIAFLNDWAAKEQIADLNGDGVVNTLDFIQFLNLWAAGC
ncbi:MAG TPA: GC-type dockerin domain-anchored protein [Phycisphaerales bacterium]|nr:GC-type dockerin domain-anchored protein [Phycisphaerales bacterium]